MRPTNRDDLLVLVASLYYEQDRNQQEIAEQLQISRSNISRLLREAKEKGFVEVKIRKPYHRDEALEASLMQRFGLVQALVLDSARDNASNPLPAVGRLAAHFIEEKLRPNDVLAISWGTGVHSAAVAIPTRPDLHVDVVQMIGSVGAPNPEIDGPELARRLAEALGGRYFYLHAPILVDNPTVRDLLLAEAAIQETLDRARRAAVALLGIGTTEPGANSFVRAGHLTELQLGGLRAQGAVGETCGLHFDINGNMSDLLVNRRVVGLELAALRRIPTVVAVACGLPKARSILGALRGRYLNVLATDDETARAVLAHADETLDTRSVRADVVQPV
ncbi:MAG: sugar-binding transcriptional regulator [Chloroflexaceae bacterium]|jgi:DNA-binding transcriptional regulator LsrR (DeoR family)|nr:sugar-binding transcriptional regulator [Chloroflexaceae bacterium]